MTSLSLACAAAFFCFALGMEVGAAVSHASWYAGQDWWRLFWAGLAAAGIATIPAFAARLSAANGYTSAMKRSMVRLSDR